MPVIITPFTPAHRQGVIDLILPIQQQEFGIEITAADQPDLGDIPGFYQQQSGGFWVAMAGDRIVGTIGLKAFDNGQAALRKMFVAEAYRGGASGAARQLLETLLAHADRYAIETIWLGTTAQFVGAHRFYEKHGFELVEAEALPDHFPRMAVDTRFYRRRLAGSQDPVHQ
ncbi:GNAT family N-acetyltransferase [Salinicola rhizosphaerae]|uniref:N-acetyltransferase n=1 Tax=Salinicola rhizosphaerae TaxID=1443141 RepID=A0ABQ3DWS1_9GAMM|nr:GNAT family N-acetyltransferase [Salinicola rhizosphaerae]GHB16361.1 N-acetyltransferase [Salinicola rhizosphaerae]